SRSTRSAGVSASIQGRPMKAASTGRAALTVIRSERRRADDKDELGLRGARVDEPMRQLAVDLDAVAGVELVGPTRDFGEDVATQGERGLFAEMRHRRRARGSTGRQREPENLEFADRVGRHQLVFDVAA